MERKPAITSSRAKKLRPQPEALPEDAEEIAKMGRFLRGMAEFEEEQAAKAFVSAITPHPSLPATGQPVWTYELPLGIYYISSSLKIDDPPTPMRIGHLSTLIAKMDPVTAVNIWVGFTWAETFYPVEGEKPKSVVGSKAYEVVLKQSTKDSGQIVRENVVTTGRVIGEVIADLPHETVSVRIEGWFLKSDVFKKGRWNQLNAKRQTGNGVRGGENGESSVKASCTWCAGT